MPIAPMSRSFHVIPASLAAVALAFVGFHLTGILASQLDPEKVGITTNTAFVVIACAAWGLPTGLTWFAVGAALPERRLALALLAAGAEVFVLLLAGLLQPPIRIELANLQALASTLLWPVAFIALFALLGMLLGARARQVFIRNTGVSS